MIPNPILYNDNTIMLGLVLCCVVILAVVMIPKAIRHRKKVRENENIIPNQENQELEMKVVEVNTESDSKKMLDYKSIFIRRNEIKARKSVYISRDIHDKIVKLITALEDTNITIGGYIDTVLSEHLEQHKDEINEIYRKSRENLL